MPLIRKVIAIGKTSKGVILPKGWLQYYEGLQGLMIQSVVIEVNHELKITPIFNSKGRKGKQG